MKQLLILAITPFIFLSCNQKKIKENQSETQEAIAKKLKKTDTTVVYWPTNFDTIRKNQEVRIGNDIHQLEFKTYSLNDSSIVRVNDLNKNIYHDYITEISLNYGATTILTSQINKAVFKDSLDGYYSKYAVLRDVSYRSIRSNRIYFNATIYVPETDCAITCGFGIFYRTKHKGDIHFWGFRDIEF